MQPIVVVTWNLQGRDPSAIGLHDIVADRRPSILFLQEADPYRLAADAAIAAHLPHRLLRADVGHRPGMGILSALRIASSGVLDAPGALDRPRAMWAALELPGGGRLVAVSVHATAPDSLLPPPYNPLRRNRQLAAIRAFAHELLATGERLVIAGDFNTVRYRIEGMVDAAEATGGERPTWRGVAWRRIPPFLRLDRIFVGPGMAVRDAGVEVEYAGSDHCPVWATVDVRQA
jgi:endonuclease/exonuclease/phosphatase family metal-dependent hydrolase